VSSKSAAADIFRFCIAPHLGSVEKRLNRSRCRLGWSVGFAWGRVCYAGVTVAKGKG